jgi:hypothetical protein
MPNRYPFCHWDAEFFRQIILFPPIMPSFVESGNDLLGAECAIKHKDAGERKDERKD